MVSCLMGDSTALASAIVRCCLNVLFFIIASKRTNFIKALVRSMQSTFTIKTIPKKNMPIIK